MANSTEPMTSPTLTLLPLRITSIALLAVALSCAPPPSELRPRVAVDAAERASLLLTGAPLSVENKREVESGGLIAYTALVDEWLSQDANPALAAQVRAFFLRDMELEDRIVDVTHPVSGEAVQVSLADGADLATSIVLGRQPFTNLLVSEECVRSTGNGSNPFESVPCTTASPVEAGLLTQHGFLLSSPSVSGLERIRTLKLYLACEDQQESSDEGWASCNACEGDEGTHLSPQDPAGPNPRIHAKYAAPSNESWCATCHHWLNPRRPILIKYDEDGFYTPGRTLFDAEPPENNFGRCIAPPIGATFDDLTVCPDPGFNGPQDNDFPFGCCVDAPQTDPNAALVVNDHGLACVSPDNPWCMGEYYGNRVQNPREWAELLVNPSVDGGLFQTCAATRSANHLLGRDLGAFRERTTLRPPRKLSPTLEARFVAAFVDADLDLLALWRAVLLDDAFVFPED